MPISIEEVEKVVATGYRTIKIQNKIGNMVMSIYVTFVGILGGVMNPKRRKLYHLFIDLVYFPTAADVWILFPPADQIRHVNIYPRQKCHHLNKTLPRLCMGTIDKQLEEKKISSLLVLLSAIKVLLNQQNISDPARRIS
ncbi:MAG: hypothetical protein ACFFCQ_08850 [Promethearchaeota archaeon]